MKTKANEAPLRGEAAWRAEKLRSPRATRRRAPRRRPKRGARDRGDRG